MKSCRDIDPDLDRFADGECSPAQALEVRTHIEDCVDCRRELRLRTRLKLRLQEAIPGAPAGLRERLDRALDAVDRPPARRRWFAAAAAAAVLVTSALLLFPGSAPALPAVVAASSAFHDRVVEGAVSADTLASADALRAYFR